MEKYSVPKLDYCLFIYKFLLKLFICYKNESYIFILLQGTQLYYIDGSKSYVEGHLQNTHNFGCFIRI